MRQVEAILLPLPERRGLFTAIGLGFGGPGRVTNGFIFLNLKPHGRARSARQQQIVQHALPAADLDPRRARLRDQPAEPRAAVLVRARWSTCCRRDDYDELEPGRRDHDGRRPQKLGYLVNLDTDLRLNKPQLDIIDRPRPRRAARRLGDRHRRARSRRSWAGEVISNFKRGTKQYDVIAADAGRRRAPRPTRSRRSTCAATGGLVQLANVVQVKETVAPKELNHYNRVRSATITANLVAGREPRHGARRPRPHRRRRSCPPACKRELAGQSREFTRVEREPLLPVPARGGLHLPGARGAVRELHPPAHDPALGAAGGGRARCSRSSSSGRA